MTREQHLVFCRKCVNRKMDLKQGLICQITEEKADFTDECENYERDEEVRDEVVATHEKAMSPIELDQLPPEIYDKLLSEQKLVLGIIAGLLAGILGAYIWAAITVSTGYQIGYLALAVGAGVGLSMRFVGKGIQPVFGFWGAGIALLSVVLGNLFSIFGFVAQYAEMGVFEVIVSFDFALLPEIMEESFSPIDLLFYGIATYEGYKFAFRKISSEEINSL